MAPEVFIRCHLCHGSGKVVLTGEYLSTFLALAQQKTEVTGAALARTLSVRPTAMNNRLAVLERHGLATSRRCGRKRLYRAAPLTKD